MQKAVRHLLLAFCALTIFCGLLQPVGAYAQLQPVPYTTTGLMGLAMHTGFAASIQAQGIHYNYLGYTAPTRTSYGGFPVIGGNIVGGSGYGTGEILCSGELQFISGTQVMGLRNLVYSNTFAGVTVSGAIFFNGIYQGRQTLFTSPWNELGYARPGAFVSDNSYLGMDPGFQRLFTGFFQTPQLLNDPNFPGFGFAFFTLNVQTS